MNTRGGGSGETAPIRRFGDSIYTICVKMSFKRAPGDKLFYITLCIRWARVYGRAGLFEPSLY